MDHFWGRRWSVARLVLVGRLGSEMGSILATDYRISLHNDQIVKRNSSLSLVGVVLSLSTLIKDGGTVFI